MSNTITVFTATELKEALLKDPDSVLTLEAKKDGKDYSGSKFMNAKFNIGDKKKKEGWFNISNVQIRATADPSNKEDKRNNYKALRNNLDSTVSRAGDWGEAMEMLDKVWKERVAEAVDAGNFSLDHRRIHDLCVFEFSKDWQKKNPGKTIEDPGVQFQMDFGNFPDKYPHKSLAGKPKTQIFDYNTAYTDEKGNIQYKLATVKIDGKEVLVDESNHHLFITNGSVIRSGRVMMPSACQSQSWISFPVTITRCVIEPGGEEMFSDEVFPVNTVNTVTTDITPKTVTKEEVNNSTDNTSVHTAPVVTDPLDLKDIDDFISKV